jgi:hypothetical protein
VLRAVWCARRGLRAESERQQAKRQCRFDLHKQRFLVGLLPSPEHPGLLRQMECQRGKVHAKKETSIEIILAYEVREEKDRQSWQGR